jgi:hypothetical protein
MRFNSFEQVALTYTATAPIASKDGKAYDLRPIGERRRPWERIIRVSADCYVLSDGWHWGNPYQGEYSYGIDLVSEANLLTYAPIVWRRHPDGRTTAAVRNAGIGSNTVIARHRFLNRYMPRGLVLTDSARNGKYFLSSASGRSFFPKAVKTPQALRDHFKQNPRTPSHWASQFRKSEDQATLTFELRDGVFHQLGGPLPEPMRRVDREAKAAFGEDIRAFIDWAQLMLPMLDLTDWQLRSRHQANLDGYKADVGDEAEAVRNILRDAEHPNRVDMAVRIFAQTASWQETFTPEIYAERARKWINTHANFYKMEPR